MKRAHSWNWKRSLILSALLASLGSAQAAQSSGPLPTQDTHSHGVIPGIGDALGLSPHLDYQTITTPHFRITFPKELSATAQRVATHLETAHTYLAPMMRWEPNFRTQVLVTDAVDLANGLASANLRLGMILQVTPPDSWMSIAHYDDWLRLLTYHEYTHILNMDATDSWVYNGLRILFGDVFLPNSIWPSWMLEGLAVYMETALTQAGRGRSPYWEMILRKSVEDGTLGSSNAVTLDQINGSRPTWPGGETAYLFGYSLMNQAAQSSQTLNKNDDALGELSIRSAGRFPFFINGNLQNVTGKDWYQTWDLWLKETRERLSLQLQKIKSRPVTPFKPITQAQYSVMGSAFSPDQKWLAFNRDTTSKRNGLILRDLTNQKEERIADKIAGVALSFSKDSRYLFFSAVRRYDLYSSYSEIGVYDLVDKKLRWLTDGLRAKDPDVSADGQWLVFTQSKDERIVVARARIERGSDPATSSVTDWKLSTPEVLAQGERFSRAAQPKFRGDSGQEVIYSLHRGQGPSEELMSVDVDARQPRTLLTNGAFNRFATVLADRSIVFTSDLSGVDNLYRLREGRSEPEALTNTTTGFWFPTTNRALPTAGLKLYASAYTAQGFELAEIDLASGNRPLESLDAQAVKVERAPAPKVDSPPPLTREGQNQVEYPSSDYSIYPSILPRSWAPVFVADSNNKSSLGGLVSGFDAVDRHRYLLMAYYQNDTHRPDWYALYSNRSFGPTFHLRSQGDFSIVSSDRKLTTREIKSGIAIERPILWTYSSLTPLLGASWNRLSTYKNTIDSEYRSIHITEVTGDAKLTWRDTESSRLAIGPESGTALSAGLRGYFQPKPTSGDRTFKLAGTATQLFRITDHSVLQFKGFAARTNRRPYSIDDLLIFKGRNSSSILMSQGTDYLDSYPLRGYADLNLYAQTAAHGALDLRFPLGRLFRGWGTNPFFIEQLYGFAFYESAYFPANATRSAITLPAWGGGIRLSLEVLVRIPLVASLEYQQGTNSSYNPDQMGFFSLGLGALPF